MYLLWEKAGSRRRYIQIAHKNRLVGNIRRIEPVRVVERKTTLRFEEGWTSREEVVGGMPETSAG